jgi:type I restriction enzyme S subunit
MEGCYYQNHLHRLRAKVVNEVDPQFALLWFWYAFEVANIYIGRSNVTTIPNLSQSKLSELQIPKPEFDEQRRIAQVLTTVQTAIEQQTRLIALTRELKSALMRRLFTEGLRGKKQKETEIGLVPESWAVVKLQEAIEYIDYGYSAPIPKTEPENGVKIVSTADINREGEMLYWKIRRTIAPEKTVKRLTLVDGDILFNWRNSAELIGKTSVFEQQSEPHIFASFILRIRCDEKKTHNYFLKHLLNHYREQEVFVKLSRRAVNQANYNRNEIYELKIPFPKYEEQREIAETIMAVENKMFLHESKKNLLEELFRTLLHQLMTGQTRVNEIET